MVARSGMYATTGHELDSHARAERYHEVDARLSDVVEHLGPPSLVVDKRVLGYVGDDDGQWVFFDCWEAWTTTPYDPRPGPSASTGPMIPPGVREQLAAIAAGDPSQSLGPRRP